MIRYLFVFVFSMLLVLHGCDSPDAFDCAKKAGDVVEEEIIIEEFNRIFIYDNIELHIASGAPQKVMISGGKNLIPSVNFDLVEKDLTITNGNSCNWTRSYDPITVTITTNQLIEIESGGYGLVKSMNTLNFDELTLESKDGSGDFEVSVAVNNLIIKNNSITNMRVSGNCDDLFVGHWFNDGRFNGSDLKVKTVFVNQNGVNDIFIYAVEKITGRLTSRGNVFYFGNPDVVDVAVSGTGQLIKK
ncbi:head GIN domain-containing protein [Fulvivirgaceae bacterium BMA12]|uniref:Head GIN domain-containing protein n=1 Tax=Agaribacillus aureus TaxID=3051825 RepID=A0ABT8L2Y5_9BACT|nr:head GIN domain-containing protein [Fulvivirgaceae bacterium BMA12]